MSRGPRQAPGGYVYHALNRAVARLPLFEKPADYDAFVRVVAEALDECPIRILAFVLMPNHWHFVLWPEHDDQLTNFCRWLTHTGRKGDRVLFAPPPNRWRPRLSNVQAGEAGEKRARS